MNTDTTIYRLSGPAPDQRYERINPGGKVQRRALAMLHVNVLREYCEELLWSLFRAGKFPHTRAIPGLSLMMARSLKHGAYAMGIPAMAELNGVSPRTIIRGSALLRAEITPGRKGGGYMWHTRGRKGEGVTIWRPGHALVNALGGVRARRQAVHQQIVDRRAQRDQLQQIALSRQVKGPNVSDSQCDTVADVAAPWAAGRGGGGEVGGSPAVVGGSAVKQTTTEPDIPDRSGYLAARAALQERRQEQARTRQALRANGF